MITISLEEFRARLDDYLAESTHEDVIVTREGKPWVVVRPATEDEVADETMNPEFWKMIWERRREVDIAWDQAKAELGLGPTP